MNKLISVIQLLRLHQWLKNLFLFLPLFFDKKIIEFDLLYSTTIGFISFCFMASSIYCLNDIIDIKADKNHYFKKNRPIAKGVISIKEGYLISISCFVLSILFSMSDTLNNIFIHTLIIYFILNILYCFKLKHISIIDVLIIAISFVLRILAGASIGYIKISHWIILMTFLLALFLALTKRRDDVLTYTMKKAEIRNNIKFYNLSFLNQAISIISSIIIVSYIMYTVSPDVIERIGNTSLYMTTIFVIAGIMRYLQITFVDRKSGSPTIILMKDHFIQFCIIGWLFTLTYILYI